VVESDFGRSLAQAEIVEATKAGDVATWDFSEFCPDSSEREKYNDEI
jgi:hypothetical protein